MAQWHDCVDWSANPPSRKIPHLMVLTRGDDHVYTAVPKELKNLEEVARHEFDLDPDLDIQISSSCLDLCRGLPARITENVWEHMSPYIGCATVEVSDPRRGRPPRGEEQPRSPAASVNASSERDSNVKRKLPSHREDESERSDPGLGSKAVRDEEDALSDHGNDHDDAFVPQDQHQEPLEGEEDVVGAVSPRKKRRRRLVSEDEDQDEESERERQVPARAQVSPIASPPRPLATRPSKEVKERVINDHRSLRHSQSTEFERKPIKQEKQESGSGSRDEHSQRPRTESRYETQTQAQVEPTEKLMIRVAHRPSKQESKFTTKSTTKVGKVLAGACKSFGLDVGLATMYLIVSTEDEDGQEENLFPCDKNDSISRAGAERDLESRFLLKIAGEA